MTTEERLDYIEFRMDLLWEGTEFSRFLYESKITKAQLDELYEIMYDLRTKIENGEKVSSSEYESKVLSIVDNRKVDYHFCENFAKLLWEEERFEEVFPALYRDNVKFEKLFK